MSEQEKPRPRESWGRPTNSRKAHFFVGPYALCLRVMHVGELEEVQAGATSDDCKTCTKLLAKRREEQRR